MARDEFNQIEITNDKQLKGLEFGKTVKSDIISQKENKLPEGELNEKYVGKTIRKKTEVNVQYANKATAPAHGSTTVVTSSTTATSVAATTASVVTAASVVTVAAIAVGTGISVALHDYSYKFNSFVVTADSLTCELFIADNNNENRPDGDQYLSYQQPQQPRRNADAVDDSSSNPNEYTSYSSTSSSSSSSSEFSSSSTSSSSDSPYSPSIPSDSSSSDSSSSDSNPSSDSSNPTSQTSKKEEGPFNLRVYNSAYDYTLPAYLGSNRVKFSNLKSGERYHIVLTENRFGGETIFDEMFSTKDGASVFNDVIWDGKCNFLTNMMTVKLDYQDDFDHFSDFKFTLTSEAISADGMPDFVYDLDKTNEEQEIYLLSNQLFSLSMTYNYKFTYLDQGVEVTAKEGTVHFEDNSGAVSEFREFIFSGDANFINRTFDVQLDFVDDFNVYSDFTLTFYMMYEEQGSIVIDERGEEIPLQKTTEVQTIDLDGIEVMLTESYHYKLTALYNGYSTDLLDEGDVTFTDISGAVTEFRGLSFDKKANFDTRSFEVALDMSNDLGYLYSFQFILTDLETENERTYYLLDQTEAQTIEVNEIEEYFDGDPNSPVYYLDIVEHRMKYTFKYYDRDQEVVVVQDEEFKFKNSLTSSFQGIETSYDFHSETSDQPFNLPIRFLFDNAGRAYSSFAVNILLNDEEYAYLMFEGDTLTHKWLYSTLFNSFDGNYDQMNLVEADNVTIVVTATVYNFDAEENGGPDMIEQEVYREENVTFTANETTEIYGANIVTDSIVAGIYEVGIMPIYTGSVNDFSCYVIFETQDGNTYTCALTLPAMGNYSYVNLSSCSEGFDEDQFISDFDNPVKVTFKYAKVEAGVTPSESDYQAMVISESYQFTVSV